MENNNDYEDNNEANNVEEEDDIENNKDSNNLSVKTEQKEKSVQQSTQPKQPGTKQKRRSKNDCIGRDYVCGCGKTYLSYPALYTHIKTKHNGKTPEGTNANQVQSGRGRGRPRKNFLLSEDLMARRNRESSRKDNSLDEKNNELRDLLNKTNYNVQSYKENEYNYLEIYKSFGILKRSKEIEMEKMRKRVNEIESSVIDNEGSIDMDISRSLEDDASDNNSISQSENNGHSDNQNTNNNPNVMDVEIEQQNHTKEAINNQNNEQKGDNKEDYKLLDAFPQIDKNVSYFPIYEQVSSLSSVPPAQEKNITCDQAIALFLIEISKDVTFDFFKIVVILLKHYRDCMNKLGWEILAQYKKLNDENSSAEFCSVKDPSRLPEIANDFLLEYLPSILPNFDRYFAVVIISHFNFWLYGNDYTFINLELQKNIFNNSSQDEKDELKNKINDGVDEDNNNEKEIVQ